MRPPAGGLAWSATGWLVACLVCAGHGGAHAQAPDAGLPAGEAAPAEPGPAVPGPAVPGSAVPGSAVPASSAEPDTAAQQPAPAEGLAPHAATRALDREASLLPRSPSYGAVAVVPHPRVRLPLWRVARNVLQLDPELTDLQQPLGLQDALDAQLSSVILNGIQGNPLQPDLQYRGFTASPLLGTPQGIAVYQQGTRINEPFDNVMQWDLVPTLAVEDVQITPGADPLYGLNALGGSIALRMKNGFTAPIIRVGGTAGSFGRYRLGAEAGRRWGDVGAYAAASMFGEQGFRKESPSQALQLYSDLRTRSSRQDLGVSLTVAQTKLTGNGLSPVELLEREGRDSLFTYPDITRNRLLMMTVDVDRTLTGPLSVQASAYVRHLDRTTANGDEAEFALCEDEAEQAVLCDEAGARIEAERGGPVAADRAYDGVFNTSHTQSFGSGGTAHLRVKTPLLGQPNQFLVGTALDSSRVDFVQRTEAGYLTAERAVLGQGIQLAGDDFRTKLIVLNRVVGVFVSDSWSLSDALSVQASARLNWANIELRDQMPSRALDGRHDFVRLNPALGLTYSPWRPITLFASYSEGSRAPGAAELACADPNAPCRLPNAFVADPALTQVISRGVELGVRGYVGPPSRQTSLRWSAAVFGQRNDDDILFVAGSRVGTGYFRNAGRTRRLGAELDLRGQLGPVRFAVGYSLLVATFASALTLPSPAHPQAERGADDDDDDDDGGVIAVEPGDRIPGLPLHTFKGNLGLDVTAEWQVGVSLLARSGVFFRGDEANLLDELAGYAVASAYARLRLLEQVELLIKVENLLGAKYETFGQLANPGEVLPGDRDPRFIAPAAPRSIFAGIRLLYD